MANKKVFTTRFVDNSGEFGAIHPQAVVVIFGYSGSSQVTGQLNDAETGYDEETWLDKVTYRANYYPNQETLTANNANGGTKFRSRPVQIKDGEELTTTIEADIEQPQVKQILESNLPLSEKLLNIAEFDFRQRFK